ncbi:hypothetical protein JYU34_004269 [Plutella xylostella]|uniref:Uncharacterized protein n=1 Tax=Plutella xylostella TaxID=51655 RepID=A0ABQ7QXJ7_PLUXY|nr:uncharacterized protein LOC105383981 [Plutella xylostella]KAG7309769.1 hypothetical protein JYU34_004269 [Plutella xylostella]
MEDSFINTVVKLHKTKNWRDIIQNYHDHPERNKLLWVYPSEDNLDFLKKSLLDLNCDNILSIGCGSGLLEWIIGEATGFPIKGIEVDGVWWQCKYAPPTFIPLLFTSPELDKDTISILQNGGTTALLFCYFNNRPAFENYLSVFSGNVIVIIGPGEGTGVHTDPLPFDDVSDDWALYKWQEVRSSKDFICIYIRSNNVRN